MSAHKHSTWVISVHSILFGCCVDRLGGGGLSGSSAGAGKRISRNTWHIFCGVAAFHLYYLVMGPLGYFQAPVHQLRN